MEGHHKMVATYVDPLLSNVANAHDPEAVVSRFQFHCGRPLNRGVGIDPDASPARVVGQFTMQDRRVGGVYPAF